MASNRLHYRARARLALVASLAFSFTFSTVGFADVDAGMPKEKVARCTSQTFKRQRYLNGTVEKVVDGDTIHFRTGGSKYNIRFLGIDTPETKYQGKSQGYWGEQAAARLAELLPLGTHVRVELDEETCDAYGRVLGHVWRGNININERMLRAGLAANYCIWPNLRHCREYGRRTDRNIRDGRGMWGDHGAEIPYEWRRLQSGRPYEKYVGDIDTKRVYAPDQVERVSVGNRVFFFDREDIQPPFRLVD